MARPEGVEEVVELAGGGVVLHADDLVVVRGAGADVLVGRLVEVALAVADLGARDSRHALERELHAPEAAGAELRELVPGRGLVLVGPLRQRRRRARAAAQPAQAQLPKPAHRGARGRARAGLPARREEVDRGGGAVVESADAGGEEERGGGGGG